MKRLKKTRELLSELITRDRNSDKGAPIPDIRTEQVREELDDVDMWLHLYRLAVAILIGALFFIFLSSCNQSKQAAKHFRKFQENGGKVICPEGQPIVVDDTTVINFTRHWSCPEIEFPKSNVQVRQEEKTERVLGRQSEKSARREMKEVADVAKHESTQNRKAEQTKARQNEKTERKQMKAESKGVPWWGWLIIGGLLWEVIRKQIFRK